MATRSAFLSFAALLALSLAASAQHAAVPVPRRVSKPLRTASLDLATGTITRTPTARSSGRSFSTCTALFNNDFSGFIGTDSGLSFKDPCEWIDAADKGFGRSGGKSGYLTGFVFAYCSGALDASLGGPGGQTLIGFRSGYEEGNEPNANGPSGTLAGSLLLTGLPAHTSSSGFFGGFSCYTMEVNLSNVPLCLPDGNIGWSWRFIDVGSDGVLANTFPFLACVQSCSGPGKDGMGMRDGVDRYCPAGSVAQSFSFGTVGGFGGFFTSIAIETREAQAFPATSQVCNGSSVNPVILTNTSLGAGGPVNAPVLGAPWRVTLDCNPGGSIGALAVFRVSTAVKPMPVLTALGEVLVGPGENLLGTVPANRIVLSPTLTIPKSLNFYTVPFTVQAFCPSQPHGYLSNALLETIGSE